MSELGDLIIEHGPFTGPLRFGGFGDQDELTSYRHLNALRDELIELRAIAAQQQRTEWPADSCTCRPTAVSTNRADPNCPVHHGRRARGPKPPPVGPGCICDGSGRTCPRHGAVI